MAGRPAQAMTAWGHSRPPSRKNASGGSFQGLADPYLQRCTIDARCSTLPDSRVIADERGNVERRVQHAVSRRLLPDKPP